MNRQYLKISDEELVAEFGKVLNLFSSALKTRADAASFYRLVNEGSEQGLTWLEAVERAAEQRSGVRP